MSSLAAQQQAQHASLVQSEVDETLASCQQELDALMIEKELDKVAPTVENARKQVGSISKAHINELKSYPTPPPAVDDVFTALFKLSGEGDVSWNGMKKALSNSSFLSGISNMDARCKFKLIH